MNYSVEEVMQYIDQEDVKFIRLAFCDIMGKQKNVSVMPSELERAFRFGIPFDASSIAGFASVEKSDLFLFPDPATLALLPWRPDHGRVVRMYCDIKNPDGTPYDSDTRNILKCTIEKAEKMGISVKFGPEYEFYLFKTDENGNKTGLPHDNAGYMDIAPEDKGENVRREICLTLERMNILPESSHHEEGPGQNEIVFRYSKALQAADDAVTFMSVVRTIASRNGLYADFSPKPLLREPGNSLHINTSVEFSDGVDKTDAFIAGIMEHISDFTVFLNSCDDSYKRLNGKKTPSCISWAPENRTALIRIPAAKGEYRRFELRSPDPAANPYLAFTLIIEAGLDGVKRGLTPPEYACADLSNMSADTTGKTLPSTYDEAAELAVNSRFVNAVLPQNLINKLKRKSL